MSDTHTEFEAMAMPQIVSRPVGSLNVLPIAYRWEFTRRHPYYVQWWRLAQAHHTGEAADDDALRAGAQMAVLILANLGFTGMPRPPAASADDLDVEQLGG